MLVELKDRVCLYGSLSIWAWCSTFSSWARMILLQHTNLLRSHRPLHLHKFQRFPSAFLRRFTASFLSLNLSLAYLAHNLKAADTSPKIQWYLLASPTLDIGLNEIKPFNCFHVVRHKVCLRPHGDLCVQLSLINLQIKNLKLLKQRQLLEAALVC